jgi:colanic acid biosynthesis protein WcaH
MVNVDLLIQDGQNRTLLTWREDEHYGAGWHIPGGIIRFKETMAARLKAVAMLELGAKVKSEPTPCAVNEIILPKRQIRGHFISLLFRCSLLTPLDESLRFKAGKPKPGDWKWHGTCPRNILPVHRVYASYIGAQKT